MFRQLRRVLAIVIDSTFLFPFVFWLSILGYNEIVHWVSTNLDTLEFILFVNEYGLGLYLIFLFPLIYTVYETIAYLLFKRTLGQYFMQINLKNFDTVTIVFRAFFGISLHLVSLGVFSLANAIIGLVTGKTIIDYLSRSQPLIGEENIRKPMMKLVSLFGCVAVSVALGIYVHENAGNKCFEINCIKEVVLKDTIEQKILKQKFIETPANQQNVVLNQVDYPQLLETFFIDGELTLVPTKNHVYDIFEVTFAEDLQVYAPEQAEWLQIGADDQWQFLLAKDKTNLQTWQLYVRDFARDQFVPIRAVVTNANQNSYQWVLNVSPPNQPNTQWNIKLMHDVGTTTQITLEK